MKPIQHYWYGSNILLWFLVPLSWVYCLVISFRRKLYQSGIKRSYSSEVPVVIVGNIVAGGSGKTPLLISLCDYMKSNGCNPGVVSRGYGGSFSGVHQVTESDSAEKVGDEPLMICQRTGVPVVVGADRVAAIDLLVNKNSCDVVLSDDGLQHYRMRRDFEIAVIDAGRKFGNGFCLPAGPLRERVSRLNDVDMLVYNSTGPENVDECSYELAIVELKHIESEESRSLSEFSDVTVHAVAGIGNPQRFFDHLHQTGIKTIDHGYPDHYGYEQDDFSGWADECIIMTEKDAVKCGDLSLPNAWVVIVDAVFSEALKSRLSSELLPLLRR